MELLVVYDVETKTKAGRRRLRRVAQVCLAFGQRVQKSVFEVTVDGGGLELLTARLLEEADLERDSLRLYRLQEPRERYTRVFGTRPSYDIHDPLIL
jgi:CRISPR-associated protein Cas2